MEDCYYGTLGCVYIAIGVCSYLLLTLRLGDHVQKPEISKIHVGSPSLLADIIFLALCTLRPKHSASSSPNRVQPQGAQRSLRYTMLKNIHQLCCYTELVT